MATRYQFIDDSGETRLAGTLEPDPGGSTPSLHAAVVALMGNEAARTVADNALVPFDTTDFDTDSFWSAADKGFKIPAGMAGAYLFTANVAVVTLSGGVANFMVDFNAEPVLFSPKASVDTNGEGVSLAAIGQFAVGDKIGVRVDLTSAADVILDTTTQFGLTYLGPTT